ncbi:MAG: pilus assembly protein TadG-related protein, partial [Candidatus Eremiobacteraeota bacterium]|nr:pilus assembly protein TadG-related protein [Candidatus Eremiobacteraeota bacterium]
MIRAVVRPPTPRPLVRSRRGATIPLVCVLLTALLGGAALAVDIGRVYLTATEAQAAADAGALAAGRTLQQYQPYYWVIADQQYG